MTICIIVHDIFPHKEYTHFLEYDTGIQIKTLTMLEIPHWGLRTTKYKQYCYIAVKIQASENNISDIVSVGLMKIYEY